MMRVLFLSLLAAGCSPADSLPGLSLDTIGEVISGEIVIGDDLSAAQQDDLGVSQIDWNEAIGWGLYQVNDDVTVSEIQRRLAGTRGGAAVESNRPVQGSSTDPYWQYQWNMQMIDVEGAWKRNRGAGVTVAVLDTGVSFAGEDKPRYLDAGWDFVDNDANPSDEQGHGTHVAGTIAQATDNNIGTAGVAPDVTVLAVRVLDANGAGSTYGIAQGITWAADNGADVINMSLGSAYGSQVQQDAIRYAADRGVVIVCASGNDGRGSISYPARYPETIAVGAVGADSAVAPYSNGGTGLDVVAPGGNMNRDDNGDGYADGILQETLGGYEFFEGTSMASPHVAGVAALLLAEGADPSAVRGLLTATADDLEGSGWDSWSGYGLINPSAALDAVQANPATPDPTPAAPSSDTTAPSVSNVGGTRSGSSLTLTWTTDEAATSQLEFQDYGVFGDDTSYVTDHSLSFTIDPTVRLNFRFIATDPAGNATTTDWWYSTP